MGMGTGNNVSLNAMSTADAGNTLAGGTLMTSKAHRFSILNKPI
jgi:hypothetical protein